MKIQSYHELEVWQVAMDLADFVYKETEDFPKREWFGLAGQIRKSATSIPSNIAEGSGRANTKELIQFLYIARGSLCELETQIQLARRRTYVTGKALDAIMLLSTRVSKMIMRLIQSLQK